MQKNQAANSLALPTTTLLAQCNSTSQATLMSENLQNKLTYNAMTRSQMSRMKALNAKPTLKTSAASPPSTNLNTMNCGDVLWQSASLVADLDCSGYNGIPLILGGQDIVLDGGGHKLIANSTVQVDLLVTGQNQTVQNLSIQGGTLAIGVLAYDTNGFTFNNNTVNGLGIGVDYFADQSNAGPIAIQNNIINDSCVFGLRIQTDPALGFANPVIQGNDFTDAQQYAMQLQLKTATVQGSDANLFVRAKNGIQLIGQNMSVSGLDLSSSQISGTALLVFDTLNLQIQNTNLSSTQNSAAIGLNLYDVQSAVIQNLVIQNGAVGIKSGVDSTNTSQISASALTIHNQTVAGLMLQASDSGIYTSVSLSDSDLRFNPAGFALWIVSGTNITPTLQNVQF